ncbi:unnamed protein product [Cunninghamella blakesleeana]
MYLPCKLLYISVFALLSAAPPYLSIYYHDVLGFTSDQIGLVLAIAPFIQSLACPLWTVLVDKKPTLHGFFMSLTGLLGGLAVMGILVIGHLASNPNIQLSNSTLVLFTSILALAFAFFTLPNVSLVDSAVMKILGPNKILYGEQRLWGSISAGLTILLVGQLISMTDNLDVIFYVFGVSTLFFIVFALFVKVDNNDINEHDKLYLPPTQEETYPHNANPITKILSEEKPIHNKHHQGMNYQSIPTTTANHPSFLGDEEFQQSHPLLHKATTNQSMLSVREEAGEALDAIGGVDLGLAISRISSVDQSMAHLLDETGDVPSLSILTSVRVLTFLTSTLLLGVSLSMIVNFLFLFQGNYLNIPASWIGWNGPTGGITELMSFCFAKQLTEWLGVTKLVIIAHLATAIRCIGYTLLVPNSLSTNIFALLLQTLHGIGFGIFWATAVSEVDGFFPPEQRSVAQGILGALHAGLGTGLGALIGGYLYEYYSPIFLFQASAFLCFVSIAIFSIGRLPRFNVN